MLLACILMRHIANNNQPLFYSIYNNKNIRFSKKKIIEKPIPVKHKNRFDFKYSTQYIFSPKNCKPNFLHSWPNNLMLIQS